MVFGWCFKNKIRAKQPNKPKQRTRYKSKKRVVCETRRSSLKRSNNNGSRDDGERACVRIVRTRRRRRSGRSRTETNSKQQQQRQRNQASRRETSSDDCARDFRQSTGAAAKERNGAINEQSNENANRTRAYGRFGDNERAIGAAGTAIPVKHTTPRTKTERSIDREIDRERERDRDGKRSFTDADEANRNKQRDKTLKTLSDDEKNKSRKTTLYRHDHRCLLSNIET